MSRLRRFVPRLTRGRAIAACLAVIVLGAAIVVVNAGNGEPVTSESHMLTVKSGPGRDTPISLDTTLYLPESASKDHPVPAVLVAHGFGGSKDSVATDAHDLAARGYAVLAWSARGFGRSSGTISLDDPDYEVNDARGLIDYLAQRPDILQRHGDVVVGVVGGSYGGALALMLAGYDTRVDAIVPQITWNNLARAFFPESSAGGPAQGVFKSQWAGLFFGSGSGISVASVLGRGAQSKPHNDVQCGRFTQEICAIYLQAATTGRATPEAIARLEHNSPAPVLNRITAPTLLIQGQTDTLFPLAEADANARGIAAHGTPVRVAWYSGGHDSPGSDEDTLHNKQLTLQWLDHYLKGTGPDPGRSFTYSAAGGVSARNSRATTVTRQAGDYPGLHGRSSDTVALTGAPQQVANPPGSTPAAISSLPGLGSAGGLASGLSIDVPGQYATFQSRPFAQAVDVVGAPQIRVRASVATAPAREIVLYAKLYDVGADGKPSLPQGLIAPVRLPASTDLASADPVSVTLPAIAHRFEAGHRARIVLATSDQAFHNLPDPAVYTVAVAGNTVTLPLVPSSPVGGLGALWRWILLALVIAVALGVAIAVFVVRARHRRVDRSVRPGAENTPLVIEGLRKAYGDGYLAVRDVSFEVGLGQVVGLLGPNGAGKTTTLRMLMGLISPTAGEILVFGHRVSAGAPVLSRIGAFVEGSGFLPHLSGGDNLRQYWRATGRPEADAHVEEALEIAGLGAAIDRRVKAYSQGMRQRLAIAQAMLGLPDLLVLDEPTNGLDPPQIREMREVLKRYATDGRTVLVSSHLLAEVEQTCTHVVVMHKGELVASGPVEDIVGESTSVLIEVTGEDAVAAAVKTLTGMAGVSTVEANGSGLVVDLDGTARSEVVRSLVGAGVGVERIAPRRRLEDVFLALVEDK
ncbi:MAG: abc transporter related protein [Actinomycetia bacterium]|nr:abc transporter related protein [Actinomycetes bacterium]